MRPANQRRTGVVKLAMAALSAAVIVGIVGLGTIQLVTWRAATSTVPALEELNASVEQGAYIARASNCATCHTSENGEEYAGGAPFHTPFGLLYSTNITPDANTGIGNWSFDNFYRSMKHGIRPDGAHLYPAFPYTNFARLSDKDIGSLYLFLKSLAQIDKSNAANKLDFPFNQRSLMALWKVPFHNSDAFVNDEDKSDAWNRGRYLVEGAGHCGACHSPRNALGAEKTSLALTGGIYQDKVLLGFYRQWSAVNLTQHTTGLGSWSEDNIFNYLKTGISDRAVVQGPMNEVVIHSTSHLSDDDLRAMATYLKALPAKAQAAGKPPGAEVLAKGETGYTVHCGSCHLPTGAGDSVLGVPLTQNPIVQAADPSSLINVILYGPHLPPPPFVVDRSKMKMFGKRLSDQDIAEIASYVRNAFGNTGAGVSAAQVKRQR